LAIRAATWKDVCEIREAAGQFCLAHERVLSGEEVHQDYNNLSFSKMVRSREGVTIDEALQLSVGEFGREQKKLYFLVSPVCDWPRLTAVVQLNIVTILTMMQIYSVVFVELNPLAQDSWKCRSPHGKTCQSIYKKRDQLDIVDLTELFCSMTDTQSIWINP